MKRLKVVTLLLIVSAFTFVFCSCTKKEECTIYGTVMSRQDNGRPLAGVVISVENKQHAVTGMDGYYEVSFVPDDADWVRVTAGGDSYGSYYASQYVEVDYGERVKCDFLL